VAENVAVGREAGMAGENPLRHLRATRPEWAEVRRIVDEVLELCGLAEVAERQVGDLSTGQRRLVELARALAGRFRCILLDEPSSGLDVKETDYFGGILRSLAERGLGILIVEHDMALVMSVCDYLYVLDFGTLVFEGTPAEVKSSPVVRAAYLGSEELLEEAEMQRQDAEQAVAKHWADGASDV